MRRASYLEQLPPKVWALCPMQLFWAGGCQAGRLSGFHSMDQRRLECRPTPLSCFSDRCCRRKGRAMKEKIEKCWMFSSIYSRYYLVVRLSKYTGKGRTIKRSGAITIHHYGRITEANLQKPKIIHGQTTGFLTINLPAKHHKTSVLCRYGKGALMSTSNLDHYKQSNNVNRIELNQRG